MPFVRINERPAVYYLMLTYSPFNKNGNLIRFLLWLRIPAATSGMVQIYR